MKKTALQQAIDKLSDEKSKYQEIADKSIEGRYRRNLLAEINCLTRNISFIQSLLPTEKEQIEESHIASMLNYHLTEYVKPADTVLVDTWKIDAAEYFTNTYGE